MKKLFAATLIFVMIFVSGCTSSENNDRSSSSNSSSDVSQISSRSEYSDILSNTPTSSDTATNTNSVSTTSTPVSSNPVSSQFVSSKKPASSVISSVSSKAELPKTVDGILETMTLEEKVYQMFIVEQEQLTGEKTVTSSGEKAKTALAKYPVGGIVYFSKNIKTPKQCTDMISVVQSYSEIPLFIAVDEEGGRVARIANNGNMGTTKFSHMSTVTSTDEAYNVGYTIGKEIKEFGFNLDFAPVADVNSNPDNPIIGNRSFSSDPETAAKYVKAAVNGFNNSGMLCTLKHFPGHGDTSTDSHKGYAEITKSLDELEACEFLPFKSGVSAGADFVMVGHLSAPQITGNNRPATLSKTMIDLLKNDIGFNGLIITDSMQMDAITDSYTSATAAKEAVKAGVDVILMPDNLKNAANGIINAVKSGEISESRIDRSVKKILKTKINSGII